MIPPPSLLGIADPAGPNAEQSPQAVSGTTKRTAWQPTHDSSHVAQPPRMEKAQQTDLDLDPSADHDRFTAPADERKAEEPASTIKATDPKANLALPSTAPPRSRWKPVKAVSTKTEAGATVN
jgi:hypothetical protein